MRLALLFVLSFASALAVANPVDVTVTFDAPVPSANQRAIDYYTLFENCDGTPTPMAVDVTQSGQRIVGLLQTNRTYHLCMGSVDVAGVASTSFSNVQTVSLQDIFGPNPPGNFNIEVHCSNCAVTINAGQ